MLPCVEKGKCSERQSSQEQQASPVVVPGHIAGVTRCYKSV